MSMSFATVCAYTVYTTNEFNGLLAFVWFLFECDSQPPLVRLIFNIKNQWNHNFYHRKLMNSVRLYGTLMMHSSCRSTNFLIGQTVTQAVCCRLRFVWITIMILYSYRVLDMTLTVPPCSVRLLPLVFGRSEEQLTESDTQIHHTHSPYASTDVRRFINYSENIKGQFDLMCFVATAFAFLICVRARLVNCRVQLSVALVTARVNEWWTHHWKCECTLCVASTLTSSIWVKNSEKKNKNYRDARCVCVCACAGR